MLTILTFQNSPTNKYLLGLGSQCTYYEEYYTSCDVTSCNQV
jgi:hypothetical protein